MIGLKKIEFVQTSDNKIHMNATFEVKSTEILPSDIIVSVPWQDNLSSTEARVAQRLMEIAEDIMANARKSFSTPVAMIPSGLST